MNDSTGDRTQNLWFRRPAPYPLGHGVAFEILCLNINYNFIVLCNLEFQIKEFVIGFVNFLNT